MEAVLSDAALQLLPRGAPRLRPVVLPLLDALEFKTSRSSAESTRLAAPDFAHYARSAWAERVREHAESFTLFVLPHRSKKEAQAEQAQRAEEARRRGRSPPPLSPKRRTYTSDGEFASSGFFFRQQFWAADESEPAVSCGRPGTVHVAVHVRTGDVASETMVGRYY